jgi:hypothetical protein
MDKLLVAEMGVEGGGCSIYGRQADGSWFFWQEGSSIDFADEENSRSWSTEPVPDLGLVVPKEWPLYYVLNVHPEFVGWFRENYEAARGSLDHGLRDMQAEFPHRRWAEFLGF